MASHEHTPYRDNIPAYAIGALDAGEVAALEAHLESCASCRKELADYRLVSDSLLLAVPPRQPPAGLRSRLQGRLPGAEKPARPQWVFSFSRLAWGGVAAALVVMNLLSLLQIRQMQSRQASLLNQMENAQAALVILSSSNVQMFPIQGVNVSGTVLLNEQEMTAVIIVHDLPVLDKSKAYQVWLVRPNGARVNAGLFRPENGQPYTTQTVSSNQPFNEFSGIGVTVEPAGGSNSPTGERIFKVDF